MHEPNGPPTKHNRNNASEYKDLLNKALVEKCFPIVPYKLLYISIMII